MARKRKKKKTDRPEDLLAEKVTATARDLIRAIHRINPTNEGVGSKEASDRYRLKAGLQSLLIRRFGEGLLVEQPDANQPTLIGIRLRNFNEDACHAIIHELDEDARSWVQRRIDEGQLDRFSDFQGRRSSSKQDPAPLPLEAGPVEEKLSVSELLQLGRKALERFDYEQSQALYRQALESSGGGLEPALALLEILIEHLAANEEALALSESFSSSTLKDKRVRIRLAIAFARLNHIESALETIRRSADSEAAEVYYLAAKHFIAKQDEQKALDQIAALKACGSMAFVMETDHLENEIRALQAERLKPLEEKMHRSWLSGAAEEAVGLAEQILSVLPDNKAARRILGEREERARREKIEHLLCLAEKARARKDFGGEVDCLRQILAMGENKPRLKRLLTEAQHQAKRQKEMAEIEAVVAGWSKGERERALLAYAGLKTSLRERIRERIQDRHFAWLEKTLVAPVTVKPLKLAQAVLALGECEDAIQHGADPEQIITQLRIHEKALRFIPQTQEMSLRVERRIKLLEERKWKNLLEEAEAYLAAEDIPKAGERIEQLKGVGLGEVDRKRFEAVNRRFIASSKIQRLRKSYEESVKRGDSVAGRRWAGHLAQILEGDQADLWANKVTEQTDAIRKQWCLTTADLSALPGCYGPLGISPHSEEKNCLLLPDGCQLLIASAHDRWVFLRLYDINEQCFHRGYFLRTPQPFDSARIAPEGDTLWVYDLMGRVLQVCLDPFDILFWREFDTLMAGEGGYEEALLCPQSRLLWLKKGDASERETDAFEIVHIDNGRSIRRIRSSGYPIRVNAGGKHRIVLQDLLSNSVRIHSDDGRVVDTFKLETNGNSHHAAVHPNGTDFVFLPFDDTGALDFFLESENQGDHMLVLEVKPDSEKRHKPIKISDSYGEALYGVATSLNHCIVFTHFFQETDEGSDRQLAAWKPSEDGFKMVFRVPVPGDFMLIGDASGRRVAAVAISASGIEARLLAEQPPEFCAGPDDADDEMRLPPFEPPWMCESPTGAINAASLALMMQLRDADLNEKRRTIRDMKKSASADEVAGLISALDRMLLLDDARALKRWMREKYPDHYRVKIDLADEASIKSDWPRVIEVIERMPRDGLDDGSARHLCHLLGIGYFIRGDVEKALDTWTEGLAYENGRCELAPYIDYAETALMSPKKRSHRKAKNPVARLLSVFEQIDRHLAHGQWEAAIAVIESEYPLTRGDRLIPARLAEAYLQLNCAPGDRRWVCKMFALAHFLDRFKDLHRHDPVLPPCIERWPESRLEEIARKAERWLEDCG